MTTCCPWCSSSSHTFHFIWHAFLHPVTHHLSTYIIISSWIFLSGDWLTARDSSLGQVQNWVAWLLTWIKSCHFLSKTLSQNESQKLMSLSLTHILVRVVDSMLFNTTSYQLSDYLPTKLHLLQTWTVPRITPSISTWKLAYPLALSVSEAVTLRIGIMSIKEWL